MLPPPDFVSRVLAYRTSNQSLTSGDYTTVLHDQVPLNDHDAYDSSTGLFTIPSPGVYSVKWAVLTNSYTWPVGSVFGAALSHDNSTGTSGLGMWWGWRFESPAAVSTYAYSCGSITLPFTSGNLRIKLYHSYGSAINSYASGSYNYLSIIRLGGQY